LEHPPRRPGRPHTRPEPPDPTLHTDVAHSSSCRLADPGRIPCHRLSLDGHADRVRPFHHLSLDLARPARPVPPRSPAGHAADPHRRGKVDKGGINPRTDTF